MSDIIATIDEATAPACVWCSSSLRPDGPSPDFCGEPCQQRWLAAGKDPLPGFPAFARFAVTVDTSRIDAAFAAVNAAFARLRRDIEETETTMRPVIAAMDDGRRRHDADQHRYETPLSDETERSGPSVQTDHPQAPGAVQPAEGSQP